MSVPLVQAESQQPDLSRTITLLALEHARTEVLKTAVYGDRLVLLATTDPLTVGSTARHSPDDLTLMASRLGIAQADTSIHFGRNSDKTVQALPQKTRAIVVGTPRVLADTAYLKVTIYQSGQKAGGPVTVAYKSLPMRLEKGKGGWQVVRMGQRWVP